MGQQHARTSLPWPVPVAGALLVVADVAGLLFSLLILALRCEDGCDDATAGWQLDALWIAPSFAALAAVAAVVFALRRRRAQTWVSFGLSLTAALVWYALVFG
jgi:hypothetical protein